VRSLHMIMGQEAVARYPQRFLTKQDHPL
jgi:hypothetical protein